MIKRYINFFRLKLANFLDLNQLRSDVSKLNKDLINQRFNIESVRNGYGRRITDLEVTSTMMSQRNDEVLSVSKNLLEQFNLSVDVRPHENLSWAVISIQGKPDYVKFVNLSYKDMMSINSFIRQFEHTNKIIDTPQPWMFE